MINKEQRQLLTNAERVGDFDGGTAQELRAWLGVILQDAGRVWVEGSDGILLTFSAKVVSDEGKQYVAIVAE